MDHDPKEEFLWLGVRWTPGARKVVLWVLLAAAGGGVAGLWQQIGQWLATAPVWAFIAFFTFTLLTPIPAIAADLDGLPSSVVCLSYDYEMNRGFFQFFDGFGPKALYS